MNMMEGIRVENGENNERIRNGNGLKGEGRMKGNGYRQDVREGRRKGRS